MYEVISVMIISCINYCIIVEIIEKNNSNYTENNMLFRSFHIDLIALGCERSPSMFTCLTF